MDIDTAYEMVYADLKEKQDVLSIGKRKARTRDHRGVCKAMIKYIGAIYKNLYNVELKYKKE